jgi:hypothetical protein
VERATAAVVEKRGKTQLNMSLEDEVWPALKYQCAKRRKAEGPSSAVSAGSNWRDWPEK